MSLDYQVVPLTEDPFQTLQVTLNGQVCKLNVFTKSLEVPISPVGEIATDPPPYERINPVFVDVYVNDAPIILGVICQNANRIVRDKYLGFKGDLAFYDLQGSADPTGLPAGGATASAPAEKGSGSIPGLGSRFVLTYWPDL